MPSIAGLDHVIAAVVGALSGTGVSTRSIGTVCAKAMHSDCTLGPYFLTQFQLNFSKFLSKSFDELDGNSGVRSRLQRIDRRGSRW